MIGAVLHTVFQAPGMPRLICFNKPFGVLTKFTDGEGRVTLADFIKIPGVYPAGRLDKDSEGLLLLTDDGGLQHRLSDPRHKLPKTYWVQDEGLPDDRALEVLRRGIMIQGRRSRPAAVRAMPEPRLWPRDPPVRFRRNIPTSWLEIVLTEGRNRQVRHMTAAVGYPTLRLVRFAIGPWKLDDLETGQWRDASVKPLYDARA
ncbi:MAG: pseudouridine synthase [Acidiferrobacterales bacterium]